MKKTLVIILALALIVAMAAGCAKPAPAPTPELTQEPTQAPATQTPASAEPQPQEPAGITVEDFMGRTITLKEPAKRIVAVTAAECEIVYALGAGDAMVGRGAYCNYPAEALEVTEISSGFETNVEQIIGLQPDLVIMTTMNQKKEQLDVLADAGIPVCITNADAFDFEAVYDSIRLIATLLDKNDEAEAIISGMKADLDKIAADARAAGGDGSKTVYFEVSPLEFGLWTTGTGTFMDEMCGILGVTNAFSDVTGWAEVSEEQVLGRDPDYIVTTGMYFGEGPTPVEEIMSRSGWQDMKAIKNGAVTNADSDQMSRPGPRLVEAAQSLFDFIYGE